MKTTYSIGLDGELIIDRGILTMMDANDDRCRGSKGC